MATKKANEFLAREQALKLAWSGDYPNSVVIEHRVDPRFRDIARAWPEHFREELEEACKAAYTRKTAGV